MHSFFVIIPIFLICTGVLRSNNAMSYLDEPSSDFSDRQNASNVEGGADLVEWASGVKPIVHKAVKSNMQGRTIHQPFSGTVYIFIHIYLCLFLVFTFFKLFKCAVYIHIL